MLRCFRIAVAAVAILFCAWTVMAAGAKEKGPAKLAISQDGRLLLNGRPFFFIGFSPGPPIDLMTPEGSDGWAEMAEGGMMVVRGKISEEDETSARGGDGFREYLDRAHRHGVYVWPFLGKLVELNRPGMRERLTTVVSRYRSHPAILFWKSADEPEWGGLPPEPLAEAYRLIHELDPGRLVWFCHAPRGTLETLRPYNAGCDILSTDIYPVTGEQYSLHYRFLESADEAFEYAPESAIPPQGRWTVSGLDLDPSLLPAIYRDNAQRFLGL